MFLSWDIFWCSISIQNWISAKKSKECHETCRQHDVGKWLKYFPIILALPKVLILLVYSQQIQFLDIHWTQRQGYTSVPHDNFQSNDATQLVLGVIVVV